jgi:hypothetical protein
MGYMKVENRLHFFAKPESIEATLFLKEHVMPWFLHYHGLEPHQVAVIGDTTSDLEVLTFPGIGMARAPGNAKPDVIRALSKMPNGKVYEGKGAEGAEEFVRETAAEKSIRHIIFDRDGVIYSSGDDSYGPVFAEHARLMGVNENPMITILTATSLFENDIIIEAYGMNVKNLGNNFNINGGNGRLLLLENGAEHYNVITGRIEPFYREILDHSLLDRDFPAFKAKALELIQETVLPRYGFEWSFVRDYQRSSVLIPHKRTPNLTINVPREAHNDWVAKEKYRDSEESDQFREDVHHAFVETAESLGIPYVKDPTLNL